jgi:hypothetical protein
MIPKELTKKDYVVYGDDLLPAILTPDEKKIMHIIETGGHIWHTGCTDNNYGGFQMTLRERKRIANGLVASGYLWKQDPIEFDITRAGVVALEYLKRE